MNTKIEDRNEDTNIKCEHCRYLLKAAASTAYNICYRHRRTTDYDKRCKQFEWNETKRSR
jgi:hypothetical protein